MKHEKDRIVIKGEYGYLKLMPVSPSVVHVKRAQRLMATLEAL